MYFSDEITADDKIVEGCGQSTCYLKRMKNTTQIDNGMRRCCVFGECLCNLVNQRIFVLGIGVSKQCGNEGPNTRLLFFVLLYVICC